MNTRSWLAGAACAAAVTLGFGASASAATHHPAGWASRPSVGMPRHMAVPFGLKPHTTINSNWAGYIAFAHKGVNLRYVNADFNIPSLNCAGALANASAIQLVGFQDWNATGELIGVEGTCNPDGTYSYSAFYQIGSGGALIAGSINPGDAMQANVYYDATTKKFTFYINDVTTGTVLFNSPVSCPSGSTCSTTTAQAITDTAFNGSTLPLADYGMENFTGGAVTSLDGLRGGFGSSKLWNGAELIMHSTSTGDNLATPSSLQGGSAFSTTWHTAS